MSCASYRRSSKRADNFRQLLREYDHYALSGENSRQRMVGKPFFGKVLYYLRYTYDNDNVGLLAGMDIFRDVKLTNEGYPLIPSDPQSAVRKPCVVNMQDVKQMVGFINSRWSQRSYILWAYMLPLHPPKNAKGADKVVLRDVGKLSLC